MIASKQETGSGDRSRARHPLKELVALIVNRGTTYEQIASDSSLSRDWDKDSLKQFVHRKSSFRHSERVVRLAAFAVHHFSEEIQSGRLAPEIGSMVEFVASEFGINDKTLFDDARNDFRSMQNSAFNIHFPEKILFVRFNADQSELIKIVINIFKEDEVASFSMRIVGDQKLKRFVYGTISSTAVNYYFNGLAYNVSSRLDDNEFNSIDFNDILNRRKFLSDNPLGVELIAVSNDHLYDSQFPVSFLGLSSRNTPICGVGIFLNHYVWEDYNFDVNSLVSSKCTFDDGPISELIREYNETAPEKKNHSPSINTSCADFRFVPKVSQYR